MQASDDGMETFPEAHKLLQMYIDSMLKAVRSWLSHNGKEVKRKILIKGAGDTPSLKDERIPTKEELKRIFLSSDKKVRVACVLVAHSGTRIEVLEAMTEGDSHAQTKDEAVH